MRWYDLIMACTGFLIALVVLSVIFYLVGYYVSAAMGMGNI
jgi:hypothetical protein